MQLCHSSHVMIHAEGPSRFEQMILRSCGIAGGFGVEPQVKMGIAELVAALAGIAGCCCGQYLSLAAVAPVKPQDLPHRHPGVVAHRQQLSTGLFR